jgi:hypothetical protein
MAADAPIRPTDGWFRGEDKELRFTIYTSAARTTVVDVSSWGMQWRLAEDQTGTVLVTKSTGGSGIAVTGTFNADPDVNTQEVVVTVADTDTDALNRLGKYYHELRRTGAGVEAVLAAGAVAFAQGLPG